MFPEYFIGVMKISILSLIKWLDWDLDVAVLGHACVYLFGVFVNCFMYSVAIDLCGNRCNIAFIIMVILCSLSHQNHGWIGLSSLSLKISLGLTKDRLHRCVWVMGKTIAL